MSKSKSKKKMEDLLNNLDLTIDKRVHTNESKISDKENMNAKLRLGLNEDADQSTEELDLTEFEKIYNFIEGSNKHVIITGKAGTGKCYGKDTPLLLHDGSIKPIQKISIDDYVMGADSLPKKVLSTTSGLDTLYRILPKKGESFVVNSKHILSLQASYTCLPYKKDEITNISVEDYLKSTVSFKKIFKLYRTTISFSEKDVPIEPYFLGLWLGDGTSENVAVHTMDEEIITYLYEYSNKIDHQVTEQDNTRSNCKSYAITRGIKHKGNRNCLQYWMRELDLLGNKHIPDLYKINSENVRLEILAGIIDSDGSKDGSGFSITLTNEKLIDDIIFIARSLGFSAYKGDKVAKIKDIGYSIVAYRIHIAGNCEKIPIRVSRKRTNIRKTNKNQLRTGFTVIKIGKGKYYGFEQEGEDKRHVLGCFTVSHNSSLLRYFNQHTKKEVAIVAPTGVASINVGGQTIHSMFKLKPRFLSMGDISNKVKNEVFYKLDTIIIDEISMVRADVLDAIDITLREARHNYEPFGGVQMIFFGDLFQLPPVVTQDEEHLFRKFYNGSPYFFSADVMKQVDMFHIALEKIYRQKDEVFINILNSIRQGNMSFNEMQTLNTRVNPKNFIEEDTIILSTTNAIAKSINEKRLSELKTKSHTYRGEISGTFEEKTMPTEKNLFLKEGAQIMMIKNDSQGRWVNGTIGKVKSLLADTIIVVIRGEEYEVKQDKWDKIKYTIKKNDAGKEEKSGVVPDVTGTFKQFPLKLAYAVTIHKCVYENEKVLIKNKGCLPLKNVSIGDFILSGDGTHNKCLDVVYSGELKSFRVTTESGYEIITSDKHPILCVDENCDNPDYKLVKNTTNKDYACITRSINLTNRTTLIDYEQEITPYSKEIIIPKEMNGDIGYLLGCLVGNGYYGAKNIDRVDITTCDIEISNRVINILKSFNLNPKIRNKKNNKAITIYITSKAFRNFLLYLGLEYVTGSDKKIPRIIFESNSHIQSCFLQGLFDTDGSASGKTTVRYVGTSPTLIKEMQEMLLNFGVTSYVKSMNKTKASHSQAYCLHVHNTSINNFYTYINFGIAKKQEQLFQHVLRHTGKTNSDFIPHAKIIFDKLYDEIKQHFGNSRGVSGQGITANRDRSISYLLRNVPNISYYNVFQILDYLDKIELESKQKAYLERLITSNYFYDKIKSIESLGNLPMYDLEIEDSHNFVVNGFVCHNSQGATFDRVIIDFGRGSFASGQTYVALSRCTSLEGIKLVRPITRNDVKVDQRVVEFMKKHNTSEILGEKTKNGKKS